jgi:hypothetical protein
MGCGEVSSVSPSPGLLKRYARATDNVENPDGAKVVQLNTLRAHGVAVNQSRL